jgi:hypothetical protein
MPDATQIVKSFFDFVTNAAGPVTIGSSTKAGEYGGGKKLQAPRSKLQRSSKNQAPRLSDLGLELEVWCFSGVWNLDFGAFMLRAFIAFHPPVSYPSPRYGANGNAGFAVIPLAPAAAGGSGAAALQTGELILAMLPDC